MSVIKYTNDYTQFPNKITTDPRHGFKDVSDDIASIIEQVKDLQSQGKYAEAASLVESQELQSYVISAEYINTIDEITRNLEIMCISKKQSIYYFEDEPGFGVSGDVWISGEEFN